MDGGMEGWRGVHRIDSRERRRRRERSLLPAVTGEASTTRCCVASRKQIRLASGARPPLVVLFFHSLVPFFWGSSSFTRQLDIAWEVESLSLYQWMTLIFELMCIIPNGSRLWTPEAFSRRWD